MLHLRSLTRRLWHLPLGFALGLLAIEVLAVLRQAPELLKVEGQLSVFATVFLGIFIEAVPFLFLGTLASGLVEVFVRREVLLRLLPSGAFAGALTGSLLGMLFPVCECGVIPLARRLMRKGVRLPVGIAFMLAAPVVNPVVIASTIAAFGLGPMALWRFALSGLIALAVGMVFSVERQPQRLLQVAPLQGGTSAAEGALPRTPLRARVQQSLQIAAEEFFEMGRFLILGAALAALTQTLVPQSLLLGLGSGPVLSVLVLMLLAAVLSICSTVDSFVALAFARAFTGGSVLAFLVFGPMVDIKSTLLYLNVFRRRTVLYILLLTFMLTLVGAVFVNLYLPWA
jgi:uncharacterized membrane protein YraQ (UPF0718 family)